MPTYRTTARNQFRSPSGAVNEAPDGPGAMATLLDDVDNFLGVGGAEYAANAAAVTAIPASRRFIGKRTYQADTDTEYRWDGTGWRAWLSGWIGYTPTVSGPNGALGAAPGWVKSNCEYRYVSGKVRYRGRIFLNGGTAALTGQLTVSLPVATAALTRLQSPGQLKAYKVSTATEYTLAGSLGGASNNTLYTAVIGTNGQQSATSATLPFTWAQSDELLWEVEYDVS